MGAAVALVLALTAIAWERCGIAGCPDPNLLRSYQPGGAPIVTDRQGKPFAELRPVERQLVPLDALPRHVAAAFTAIEDKRFYTHGGIDWRRMAGALLANVRARGVAEGGSTITMQLARNIFPDRLPGSQRTLPRKVLELRVAREIEQQFTKREILELYLNHIYFGNGAYGIEAAARQYFGKSAANLQVWEAATLAALVRAPARYDPRRHPARSRQRRNLVLTEMGRQKLLAPALLSAATQRPLTVAGERSAGVRAQTAGYFVAAVRHLVEEELGSRLYTRRLRVVTTLDLAAQAAAERELRRQLESIESGAHGRFRARPYATAAVSGEQGTPYLQGAVIAIEVETGDVLAYVGGRDYRDSPFDRITRARRQVGSVFKPFVYAAALAGGNPPSMLIDDRPVEFPLPGGRVYAPVNYDGGHVGTLTMRQALAESRNVPAVLLGEHAGLGAVAAAARDAGIESEIAETPAMSLGTAALSPLEVVRAYAMFAGLGRTTEPHLVARIEDEAGNVIWEPTRRPRGGIDSRVAFVLTDMLRDAVDTGTGQAIRAAGFAGVAAGKTGTTSDGHDAWFAGYTPDVAAVVWIGFDQPRPIVSNATGGGLAAPVWGRMMRTLYAGRRAPAEWPVPAGVAWRSVDPESGQPLADGCEANVDTPYQDLFIDAWELEEVCPSGRRGWLAALGLPRSWGGDWNADRAARDARREAEDAEEAREDAAKELRKRERAREKEDRKARREREKDRDD